MNKSVFMLLALCGLLSCYSGSAQHYRWQQDDTTVTESGGAQTAAVDNFGNMYVSATQFTPSGLPGVTFLMKEDMNTGLIKWKKAIPGPSNETTITTDRKGNVYLFFPGHIAFNSDSYEILKTDSSGNIIWTKVVQAFGLTSYNWVAPYAITTDNFGYFYVSGWTNTSGITEGSDTLTAGPGQPFSFIVKYDTAGHKIWSKVFSATGYTTAPGIVADQAGDLLVGATTDSAVAFRDTTVALPFEGSALIVAKCDSNLNLKWIAINKHTPKNPLR